MTTIKKTVKKATLPELVDELGETKTTLKMYSTLADKLITAIKKFGVGTYEGDTYNAMITERVAASTTDWEKVALEAQVSKHVIAANTRTVTVTDWEAVVKESVVNTKIIAKHTTEGAKTLVCTVASRSGL